MENLNESRAASKIKAGVAAGCACLMIAGGALAVLTASDSATNHFTVVSSLNPLDKDILTEPAWDALDSSSKIEVNPGYTITKDPTLNNVSDVDCYGLMKVVVPTDANGKDIFTYTIGAQWASCADAVYDATANTRTYWYAYENGTSNMFASGASSTLFETVTMAKDATLVNSGALQKADIDITGYLVQANGVANVAAAMALVA